MNKLITKGMMNIYINSCYRENMTTVSGYRF